MSGYLPCMAMLSMSRHISMLNYLGSADTCLTRTVIYWLFLPAITDSANKCSVFGGRCDRQFAPISMLPYGDCKQYFISIVCLRDGSYEPRDCGPLVTFVLRHHVIKVLCSVCLRTAKLYDR